MLAKHQAIGCLQPNGLITLKMSMISLSQSLSFLNIFPKLWTIHDPFIEAKKIVL